MRKTLAILAGLVFATGACSSPEANAPPENTELTVFAAASLTAAFKDVIGPNFEAANDGMTVAFNFAASDALAGQIQSEGTADVFASASGIWMDAVQDDPGVSSRTDFATNQLVIITPRDNPADITSIDDLANEGVQLVLAAEGVPVGDYARESLENAGILEDAEANIVSNEEDDASVVAKITSGEADAAIVYDSDVSAAADNDVHAVKIPEDANVVATYPIAVVAGSSNADLAAAFIAYVTSPEGQATLATYGFGPRG